MPELYLHVGYILPMGYAELLADDKDPKYSKGQIGFMRDDFGLRLFRYMHNSTASAVAKGDLQARAANTTITNITSGTTTSITLTAAGWTADAFIGRLLICTDDAGAAGAAPEGEVGVIVANTATVITIDSGKPFTAAPAANDDFTVYSIFDLKDAADGDLARDCVGIPMQAVSTLYWGVWQIYGFCPDVIHTAAAVTAGDPIVADAAKVGAFGTDGQELWVGWSPNGMSSDNATVKALAFIDLFSPGGPGTAP